MKRRHFTATATATATAALAATPFAARGETGEKLKVGQFGTKHAHARGKLESVQSLPDLYEVVGVVEPDDAQWDRVKEQPAYAACRRLTADELFATPGLRAVVVETGVRQLVPTATRCLEAGFSIHLDKPAGESLEDCRAMHALAEEKGLTIQMGYMLRYLPSLVFAREIVAKGWLGEITEVSAVIGKFASDDLRKELAQYPGGGMFELACHLIDQVVTILGAPDRVEAFTRRTFPGQDAFADNQLAVFAYPKALATVRCNHVDPFGGPRRQFTITGTQGHIELQPLESGNLRLWLDRDQEGYAKGTHELRLPYEGDRYAGEFRDLARVLRGEKDLAWDGAHDVATHEAILRASGML